MWLARTRIVVMAVVGLSTALLVGVLDSWWRAPALGWAAAAIVYDGWVWTAIARMDAGRTRAHAVADDPDRAARDTLVLAANLASLIAVGLLLVGPGADRGAAGESAHAALAVVTVVASWLLVHTLFTQRYADEYYRGDPPGGIGFNQDEPPDYLDFAYMSFSVGMTYQVSDNSIETSAIRRTALVHSLLAFVFGTGILATTINLVVGLAQGG